MNKYLGIPIILAYFFGYRFPFVALDLSYIAFFVLILMMFFAYLTIDLTILKKINTYKEEIFISAFTLFILTPLIQWLLCHWLLKEESLIYGTFFASLCPIAIVAPQFTKIHKGNEELSSILMILSLIMFPFIAIVELYLLTNHTANISLKPMLFDMVTLALSPLLLVIIVKTLFNKYISQIKKAVFPINMFSIAFLAFIYFGASLSKLNISYTSYHEIAMIFLILIIQDFLTYFLVDRFFGRIFSRENTKALAISTGMKNFAMSGAVLLFYDPKASLASALGFFVHALFYTYLLRKD